MSIFITLAGVAIIPILLITLFPKNRAYFEKAAVRGFGLGVYLILVLILIREAIEISGVGTAFSWFGGGLLVSLCIGLAFKEFHHHHNPEEGARRHNLGSTWRILISDFFHNIVDGIAIIAGFAFSPTAGAIAFLGVLGHQIIQQAGQQILLVESGMRPARAITISLVVACSIFLGLVFQGNGALETALLALAAGIVSWKVVVDILEAKWTRKMVLGFALGAFLLAAILLLVPHSHEHPWEEPDHVHDHEHEDEHKH